MTILPPTVIHWVSPSVMSPPAALPAPRAEGRSGGRPTSARRFAAGAWTGCIVRVAPNGELVEQQIARYSEIVRSHGAAELGLPPTTGCPCLERSGGGRQPPDEVATEAGIRLFQALADWAEWARTVPPAAPTPKPPARPRRRRAPSEAS